VPRIANAQISYFVSIGEYDSASRIANESKLENKYYEMVVPNLISIYTKSGLNATIAILSTCVLPTEGSHWGTEYITDWNDHKEIKTILTKHNEYIDRFMSYLQTVGENDAVKTASVFLSSNYPGGPAAVAKIKAKYGLK
jgi:hypothetical protein